MGWNHYSSWYIPVFCFLIPSLPAGFFVLAVEQAITTRQSEMSGKTQAAEAIQASSGFQTQNPEVVNCLSGSA